VIICDEAGAFAYRTALPGKRGVGGCIMATLPSKYSIAVWNSTLNVSGNWYKAMRVLQAISTKIKWSMF